MDWLDQDIPGVFGEESGVEQHERRGTIRANDGRNAPSNLAFYDQCTVDHVPLRSLQVEDYAI